MVCPMLCTGYNVVEFNSHFKIYIIYCKVFCPTLSILSKVIYKMFILLGFKWPIPKVTIPFTLKRRMKDPLNLFGVLLTPGRTQW